MATARTRSSPRCCWTSATSVRPSGHRDLERVVDRRQVAVEHCVEHDALDLDDPPDGTVLSGHAALLRQLSRGARTVPEASTSRADPCQQSSRIAPRRAGVRAALQSQGVGRDGCAHDRERLAVRRVARVPADDDLGGPHDARLRRHRRRRVPAGHGDAEHRRHGRPRRRGRRRAPRARAGASGVARSAGSSPSGTGLGGVVRTCRTTASASARHSAQSSQCSRCSSSAARSTSLASPSAAMEIQRRAISQSGGSGCWWRGAVMVVWRAERGRGRTPDGCLFPPAWTRSAWKSLHAAAELRRDRLRPGARRAAGRPRAAHRRRAGPCAGRAS